MEKVKKSKAAHWANKLAVESEPGLTTAQLMLFNQDLKPVSFDCLLLLLCVLTFARSLPSFDNGARGILWVSGLVCRGCLYQ